MPLFRRKKRKSSMGKDFQRFLRNIERKAYYEGIQEVISQLSYSESEDVKETVEELKLYYGI